MNYLHQPNLLTQFWAAVNQDFDKILDDFVRKEGWLFQDLGKIAKKADISAIYRCAISTVNNSGPGRIERLDHFVRVILVILDAAKIQWLAPWRNYVVDPSKGVIPPFLKRQVGGFFLLYMLYISQPLPNLFHRKQRILMDSRDLVAMHVFNATMQRLPKSDDQFKELARQLVVLFNDLVKTEAFEFSAFNDVLTTPSTSVRNFLAVKFCPFTKTIFTLKDVRDQLHYLTYQESPKVFQSLIAYGRHLPRPPSSSKKRKENNGTSKSSTKNYQNTSSDNGVKNSKTEFLDSKKKWTVEEIKALENENDIGKIAYCLPSILKSLDMGPVLTRRRFTGFDVKQLDLEMSQCVHSYKAYLKILRANSQKHELRKQAKYAKEGKEREVNQTVWKNYFTENFSWVDNILSKETLTAPQNTSGHLLDGFGVTTEQENCQEDDGEWETDDEEGVDEEEGVETLIDEFSNSQQQDPPSTPPNKKLCVPMSMPSI